MAKSLLPRRYQHAALLFDGVIVRPAASALGADESIQEFWAPYGPRVKCREIRRDGDHIARVGYHAGHIPDVKADMRERSARAEVEMI